jgi:tetratricopeptide (TPR) repeat protein
MIVASMLRKSLLLCFLVAYPLTLCAADQPIEVSSPHFKLITDAGDKQARHVLDNFERMRWMFQTLFPKINVDPPAPIVVLAAKNKKEFEAVEPAEYLAKGQLTLAGYFLSAPDRNFILLRLDAENDHPFATVYHEYTHLQFREAGDWMPLWLNEGIAEFFQNTDFHDKQVMLGEPSADDILYLRQNSIIPLATLFRVDHNSPYYHEENKGSVFYSESWALTHYLQVTDRQNGTNRVSDYMMRMSRHEDPVTAAQEAFGDLKQLQTALGFYIRQQQYKQFVLNSAAAPVDSANYKVQPLTQAQFDGHRADLLAYVGRTQEARTLLQSVMQADPKNAQARETMGYLEFRDGNHPAARDWYKQAVQLDSQSFLAHYYFAAISMEDGAGDPSIEASLRTAIQLNPAFAPSYDRLAQLCSRQDDKLEEAQTLELKAIQLDRASVAFRLNAAGILMMREKLNDAQKVLESARPLAKSRADLAMLDGRINELAAVKQQMVARAAAPPASDMPPTSATYVVLKPNKVDTPPKHPSEPSNGPKHLVLGTIHGVECDSNSYLEFRVEIAGKPGSVVVYTTDRYKLDLSAMGFTPPAEMNPCHDIEGFHARVQYAESADKTIDGQLISIELRK